MLEWFTESALFPSCLGILLTIAFIGLAISSGEMVMMKIGLGIAALTALLIVTEVLIVTERERVENSLYDMAAAMRENDLDRVFAWLDNEELVRRAKQEMRGATCHSCNITAINYVEVSDDASSATADFVAFAKASNKAHPAPTAVQARIKLYFEKKSGNWKVVDFETSNPRAGLNL